MRLSPSLTRSLTLAGVLTVASGCEEGVQQIFKPFDGDPAAQSGYTPTKPWTTTGTTSFDDREVEDDVGSAQFCNKEELTNLIQGMVVRPIIPDESVGGVPIRGADGRPLNADELLGRPEDGKFCNPTGFYLDAYTWGPTEEVIVLFNQETRLVEGLIAYQQYLGTMEGDYTEGGVKKHMLVRPRERIALDGRELDEYSSRADQAQRPNSWMNNANVTRIYKAIRETFFQAPPFADNFDCVASGACDLIYTAGNETSLQDTFIVIQDSGVQLRISPEGQVQFVYLEPVRVAPFERAASLRFAPAMSQDVDFRFTSTQVPACNFALSESLTFGQFKTRCIGDDPRTLARASYDVYLARDAVDVSFNGVTLTFLRDVATSTIFKDGEAPRDADTLLGVQFTRSLEAPVEEYRPRDIANAWRVKLEAALLGAIDPSWPGGAAAHPLAAYQLSSPFLVNNPQRIGELRTTAGDSWVPQVIASVRRAYGDLDPLETAAVDVRVETELFVLETFVDAVLQVFSHGESERQGAQKFFRTTDDQRWMIGTAHFLKDGVPYRIQAQYSLNFGALTAVSVERGESPVDTAVDAHLAQLAPMATWYGAEQIRQDGNPLGLGGDGVTVKRFNRRLETLEIDLARPGADPLALVVSGDPAADTNGYLRQIRGERYEFVPSDVVRLFGKETIQVLYVERDGLIGAVELREFKGDIELCEGLGIAYGDDVRRKLQSWADTVSPDAYSDCEVVFNYSPNGNILSEIVSLKNKVKLLVVADRAVTVMAWR